MGVDLDTGIYVREPRFIPTIAQLRGIADILKDLGIIDDVNHERLYNEFDDMSADKEGRPRFDDHHGYIEIEYDICGNIPGIDGSPVRMVIDPEAGVDPDMIPAFAIIKVDQEGWNEESIERIDRDLHRGILLNKLEARLTQFLGKDIIARQSDGNNILAPSIPDDGLVQSSRAKKAHARLRSVDKSYREPIKVQHLVEITYDGAPFAWVDDDSDVFLGEGNYGKVRRLPDLRKFNGLEELRNLRRLIINYREVAGIKFPCPFPNLEALDLRSNQIKRIENLDTFINLRKLNLSSNKIEYIEGLDQLVNLQSLDLSYNLITRIEGLDSLVNLKELIIRNAHVSLERIEGLERLENLERLDLSHNRDIRVIEGLDNLVHLKELRLEYDPITKIDGLDHLVSLERLDIIDGPLRASIEGLGALKHLKKYD